MSRINTHSRIRNQNASGNRGKSPAHESHELGIRHAGNVWFHNQRRLSLPHKNIGRRRQTFRARRFHESHHHPRKPLHNLLHQANVIQHGRQ